MDILHPADLKSLIAQQGKWCISLYMPTHRIGRDQQQDPIRLKNLLAEAEAKLLANGLRRPEVVKLMAPAEELLWNNDFWKHQSNGLALFLTDGFSTTYRLPADFDELLVIANSFHIKPLLPLLGRSENFYVLALSRNNVRLFEATADTIEEVTLSFPTSMDDALWMDEAEGSVNLHSGSMSTSGGRGGAGVVHGIGPEDEDKQNVLRFFHAVDDGLNTLIVDKTVPMVLAAVEYLLPIFREASTYPNILQDSVLGNREREDLKQLHEQAGKIVQPLYEQSQKKAYEKFEQLSGQGSDLAISDLEKAVRAATFGQVESLFVPLGRQIWGRYDAENNKVIIDSEPSAENEDLLDLAATQTILNSGQVFAVPQEQVPGDGELAVILRYALPPA
jgi:hypothetical protein